MRKHKLIKILAGAILAVGLIGSNLASPISGNTPVYALDGHASGGGHVSAGGHTTGHVSTGGHVAAGGHVSVGGHAPAGIHSGISHGAVGHTGSVTHGLTGAGNTHSIAGGHTAVGGHISSSSRTAIGGSIGHLSTSRVNHNAIINAANAFGSSHANQRFIHNIANSNSYHVLPLQLRNDYLYWVTYGHINYTHNYGLYPYYHYYYWMPYSLWQHNKGAAENSKKEAARANLKWIKVGKTTIALPKKLYNKVKVGDNIVLLDDSHIQINGKVYKR